MTTRMLIDARHPEETRVAVVKGNRIEEFDFEAATRKQIKGNVYLAKVTRVEPSLQAAFVDYGGNRHGFLAFSEIHPDYYQIPREDREALLREEQALAAEHGAEEDAEARAEEIAGEADAADAEGTEEDAAANEAADDGEPLPPPEEHGGGDDAGAEALRRRRMSLRRRYKIQEVIRRRQVMLVQVVKEERGNKGAALTSYISLAGRYSVLMPNTAQGGGISRKIANSADRKRLKSIMAELNLPSTMGAIVRTAGLERTKSEIKRDFDYLARLWDEIREKTLSSTAPALIYEDSALVKRAIRDIYSRDIDEVLVDGADGYTQAKSFMKLLMPSHAKKVQPYADAVPLFHRAGVEAQLALLLNPVVTLKSGGYLVINPTEALVSIDVNSGRSTREYNIEETALKTNIEAAEEVARQLRLRDLAGLVVVDFIDMESHGNNRKVERALKDALKRDRARIQVGRISSFGLLEMSRQRLRTGVLEASTEVCPMCEGTGLVRTEGSAALAALRLLEEEAVKGRASNFRLRADTAVAVYMLNRKRAELAELEARYGIRIEVVPDATLIGNHVTIDSSGPPPAHAPKVATLGAPASPTVVEDDEDVEDDEADSEADGDDSSPPDTPSRDREGRNGRRRPRRRRGGRDRDGRRPNEAAEAAETAADIGTDTATGAADEAAARRRRPRRRGGRRGHGGAANGQAGEQAAGSEAADAEVATDSAAAIVATAPETTVAATATETEATTTETAAAATETAAAPDAVAPAADLVPEQPEETPKPKKRASRAKAAPKKAAAPAAASAEKAAEPAEATEAEAAEPAGAEPAAKPKRARSTATTTRKKAPAKKAPAKPAAGTADAAAETATPEPAAAAPPAPATPAASAEAAPEAAGDAPAGEEAPPRRGWWQRTFGD